MVDDLKRLLKEIKQDMDSYKKMFEDERVSRETQDFYLNRYSYAESLYCKIKTILENNK